MIRSAFGMLVGGAALALAWEVMTLVWVGVVTVAFIAALVVRSKVVDGDEVDRKFKKVLPRLVMSLGVFTPVGFISARPWAEKFVALTWGG